ncbi:hypothetical protein BO85DRAFT_369380, partial [Aspergillus piperis CBS 112811]
YYTQITKHKISKEIEEAYSDKNRQDIRYLINKYNLNKQPQVNIPVYIKDIVLFNKIILLI